MTGQVASALVVFGRGLRAEDGQHQLTPASTARVRAAVDYVTRHEEHYRRLARAGSPLRIVLSGGWAEACDQAECPPDGSREGDLMLRYAHRNGLDRYAALYTETRSRSTLENLVHLVEDGLLVGRRLDADRPLGLVSHAWHLPRIRFLAARVLGLRGPALLDIPAVGGEPDRHRAERLLRAAARLTFLGARTGADLIRREQTALARLRRAEHTVGRLTRSVSRSRSAPVSR